MIDKLTTFQVWSFSPPDAFPKTPSVDGPPSPAIEPRLDTLTGGQESPPITRVDTDIQMQDAL